MNNQPKLNNVNHSQPQQPTVRVHYVEALDALANIAKSTNTYNHMVNAVLMVAAIIISEMGEEHVPETMNKLYEQSQRFRSQAAAQTAAAAETPQGANDVQH
jgi:hypothetical protein